jgi:hypothetical protein
MIARMVSPPGCSRTTAGAVGSVLVELVLAVSIAIFSLWKLAGLQSRVKSSPTEWAS